MRPIRRGFTLVELLVVLGLMASLFGLVLTGTRPAVATSVRRAAQDFASALRATQSRALGRPEGAAIIINADPDPRYGLSYSVATMNVPNNCSVDNSGASPVIQSPPADGYKVRFRDTGGEAARVVSPWLRLQGGAAVRRTSAGQTGNNTLLTPPGTTLDATVIRLPSRGSATTNLPARVAMYLQHSGVGSSLGAAHNHGQFYTSGQPKAPITFVFDRNGRVAEVILGVGQPGAPLFEPVSGLEFIYVLFAAEAPVSGPPVPPLDDETSMWVAINPQTGRISVAANEPSTDLSVARGNARNGVVVGK